MGFADPGCRSITNIYSDGVALVALTAFSNTIIFSRQAKEEHFYRSAWAPKKMPLSHHQA